MTKNHRQRGVIAVEMAIILPLFGLLLLGIMEVGSITRDHQVLQNAAREGARFSSLRANQMSDPTNPTDPTAQLIRTRVEEYLSNENITVSDSDIDVSQLRTVNVDGLTIHCSQITITYHRPLLFSGSANMIPSLTGLTLTGSAVFRNLEDIS